MKNAKAIRQHLAWIEDKIAEHGWAIQGVGAESHDDPSFFYTVGLTAAGRSELCLSALSPPEAARVLNTAAKIHVGAELKHGDEVREVASVPMRVISAPAMEINVVRALYGSRARAVQLVWPDDTGKWPPDSRMAQRLYGEPWW